MSYKIIGDSCMDLTEELKNNKKFTLVPLTLIVGEDHIRDDESFNQADYLEKVKQYHKSPSSACPSPSDFMDHFHGEEDVYVITLSGELSGSHNSAVLARNLYLEENPDKNISIIDSRGASVTQTLIAMKIMEFIDQGMEFDEVVLKVEAYRDGQKTKFVLETLETLRKNGRLSGLQAIISTVLNIKPVMGATEEGTIYKIDHARGMKRAIALMAEIIKDDVDVPEERIMGIAHCNNMAMALFFKEEMSKLVNFKDYFIVDTRGVSTTYAADGGIIVAY